MKLERIKDQKMNGERQNLRVRTRDYALRIIKLYESLPKNGAVHVISHQLLRSGTSVGAHYSEGCRAKSKADFISKIEGGLQELEESVYWMELLIQAEYINENKLNPLIEESSELIAIFVTMVKNTKLHQSK
jgi:four helix bundle protein